jgi:hypothetical protein
MCENTSGCTVFVSHGGEHSAVCSSLLGRLIGVGPVQTALDAALQ